MEIIHSVVAVFADHKVAETAVKKLAASGFEMKNLSLVGKGYHTDERVVGFDNLGRSGQVLGVTRRLLGRGVGPFFGALP